MENQWRQKNVVKVLAQEEAEINKQAILDSGTALTQENARLIDKAALKHQQEIQHEIATSGESKE